MVVRHRAAIDGSRSPVVPHVPAHPETAWRPGSVSSLRHSCDAVSPGCADLRARCATRTGTPEVARDLAQDRPQRQFLYYGASRNQGAHSDSSDS